MELFITILLLVIGLALIIKGGDWFVEAASWIAEVSGIPQFIIGATIVSLATTMPELLVSIIAASKGSSEMAVGNAVGSVNANIALIMGISILFMPHTFERSTYMKKGILMVSSILVLYLLCLGGKLNMWLSFILLAMFGLFIWENISSLKNSTKPKNEIEQSANEISKENKLKHEKQPRKVVIKNMVLFIVGAAGIVGGAQLLVDNGTSLATMIGVPESIIAVTLVAIGTSLPELVTTVTAILKKKSEISIGNIIGANIIDITLILPICSMITSGSLPVAKQSYSLDMPFCLIIAAIAIIPSLIFKKFSRWQGILMISCYIGYMVMLFI